MSETNYDTQAAQAAGVQLEERVQADYWGFKDTKKHFLPDGVSYIEIRRMNEGDKAKYQKATRSDVTIERATQNAKLRSDPATERHELLKACCIDWNLKRDGQPIPFHGRTGFEAWLQVADPRLIENLEKECRKFNPWLLSDLTVEEIDKQIDDLKDLREEVAAREQGE